MAKKSSKTLWSWATGTIWPNPCAITSLCSLVFQKHETSRCLCQHLHHFVPLRVREQKKKRHISHHIDPPAAPSAWPWSAAYSHSRMQAYLPRFYTHGAVNVERFFFENTRYILLYVYCIQIYPAPWFALAYPRTPIKHVTFHIARTLIFGQFGLLSTIPTFCIKSLSCMYSCQDRCFTEGCCKISSATVRSYKKDAWLQTSPWKSQQLQ